MCTFIKIILNRLQNSVSLGETCRHQGAWPPLSTAPTPAAWAELRYLEPEPQGSPGPPPRDAGPVGGVIPGTPHPGSGITNRAAELYTQHKYS